MNCEILRIGEIRRSRNILTIFVLWQKIWYIIETNQNRRAV